ncbi:MAG TPA: polyprenyl synthetase family protein [Acidimicrobiia bacterium]|nr:polyprenyl synthetase family protein [Acidimicrobiia bacterium]
MDLTGILDLEPLADDLARVEAALKQSVETDDPFLTDVATHLIGAGGKRLRPILVLTAAAARDGYRTPASEEAVMGAVAVELVHLGSLYHDDVIDEAETRRGVESVNARWNNVIAILAGDFLLARASEIAARLGTEVAELLAATIGDLCKGQVLELRHAFNAERDEAAYFGAIDGKTAALMSTSCRIGAIVAGFDRDLVDRLTAFGRRLGTLFQLVDDILDVTATDGQLGKPAGQDIAEGVYTLPVIRALADGDPDGELRALLGGPVDDEGRERARRLVVESGAVDHTLGVAEDTANAARLLLEGIPGLDPTLVEALRRLTGSLVDRDS